ncbi:MAG: PepSY domain-containing protein [Alphaproteobacteria bacterium]|nr:PepSY domain-containing protein [Alphaproteobacteria bacterium]
MKSNLFVGLFLGFSLAFGAPAAQAQKLPIAFEMLAQDSGQFAVTLSQAAVIAKDSVPGSMVLNVKLLPSGVYAVTLKVGGSVTRVMVDATTGAVT